MLSMTAVEVSYDEPVLHGIDLEVGPGEIVCILGPSGGGKSTLLRAVAGLVDHTGSIAVAGRSLAGFRRIAAGRHDVPGRSALPHLDVASNVGFGLNRQDPQRVAQMLELVGLAGYEHRAVDTLSGGQAQRVALARALPRSPMCSCSTNRSERWTWSSRRSWSARCNRCCATAASPCSRSPMTGTRRSRWLIGWRFCERGTGAGCHRR